METVIGNIWKTYLIQSYFLGNSRTNIEIIPTVGEINYLQSSHYDFEDYPNKILTPAPSGWQQTWKRFGWFCKRGFFQKDW